MTKQIFFILAVLCTLQAQASVQPRAGGYCTTYTVL